MDKLLTHRHAALFYRVFSPTDRPKPGQTSANRPAVVLLHGFAEDSSVWDIQVEDLKRTYPLIIPDLPGSGRSTLSADTSVAASTSMEDLAEAVRSILDAEAVEKAILIGHSMGGYITLAFAERYPARLQAFGLFHSSAYADSEEKKAARRKSIEFIRNNGSPAYIRQSTPNLFAESSRKDHPEWVAGIIDRYTAFDPQALIYYQEAMIRRPDRTEVFRQFKGPVLFIIGRQDNLIPLESSLQQTYLPLISHIHILENAGHMGMLENSRDSSRILDHFLGQYCPE